MFWVLVFCALAVFSWLVCLGYSRLARFCSVMDFPNERSSHSTPTPRGGGFAFVPLGLLMLSVGAWWVPPLQSWIFWSALSGALVLWATGFVDDLFILSPHSRLITQAIAVLGLLIACLWHPTLANQNMTLLIILTLVCLPASMWGINLFNFMDGTDGLAASQSMALLIFVGITASQHAAHGLVLVCFGLLAIMTGFLVLNFPKASLFMGDSGSTVLGFMMVVFISSGSLSSPYMAAAALIGSANFIVDATLTLLRRWRAKASLMKPHRNHIYQRLARKLESHIRLLLAWHAWTLLTQVPLIIGMVFYDLSPYLAISICYGVTGIMWQCLNHRLAE